MMDRSAARNKRSHNEFRQKCSVSQRMKNSMSSKRGGINGGVKPLSGLAVDYRNCLLRLETFLLEYLFSVFRDLSTQRRSTFTLQNILQYIYRPKCYYCTDSSSSESANMSSARGRALRARGVD